MQQMDHDFICVFQNPTASGSLRTLFSLHERKLCLQVWPPVFQAHNRQKVCFNVCLFNPVCTRVCALHDTRVEVRGGQLVGIGSLYCSGGFQGSNSGHQCLAASAFTA